MKGKMTKKQAVPFLVFGVLFALVPLFTNSQYMMSLCVMGFLFAFWSIAWDIIGGYTGQMALGNGVYIGVGAFITGALFKHNGVSPWIGMIIAGIICGVVAAALCFPIFKLRGTYFAISTTSSYTLVPGAISAGVLSALFSIILLAYRIANLGFPCESSMSKIPRIFFRYSPSPNCLKRPFKKSTYSDL